MRVPFNGDGQNIETINPVDEDDLVYLSIYSTRLIMISLDRCVFKISERNCRFQCRFDDAIFIGICPPVLYPCPVIQDKQDITEHIYIYVILGAWYCQEKVFGCNIASFMSEIIKMYSYFEDHFVCYLYIDAQDHYENYINGACLIFIQTL